MPDEVIDELAWGSEAILTSTAAAAILIHNDGVKYCGGVSLQVMILNLGKLV